MALLADGVAPNDVYPMLASDAGMARAFAKLASLGRSLTWYDTATAKRRSAIRERRGRFRHRAERPAFSMPRSRRRARRDLGPPAL